MGIIKRIIKKQPFFVKKLYYDFVPFKYRYGKMFHNTCLFLNQVDNWSYSETKEYQFNELKKILKHSHNNVPFYGKLFAEYGFDPKIQSFKDLDKLPILTKEIINNNFDELISKNYRGNKILFKTSGSVGERLKFYGDDSMYKKEAPIFFIVLNLMEVNYMMIGLFG